MVVIRCDQLDDASVQRQCTRHIPFAEELGAITARERGVADSVVMQLGGWKSPRSLQIYLTARESEAVLQGASKLIHE